ncbi:MAG: flagellar hook basal-body protein [Deltaproteobacteria bacterium]|nr:MAG: flagellar hook basal-body protein [Deltaproteobacteria bacterium]
MSSGIYIGMTGAAARAAEVDLVSDNLANADTPGFKARRLAFEAVLSAQSGGQRAYAKAAGAPVDLGAGRIETTEDPMHIVPEDGAFLAVRGPEGRTVFTRDGRLTVDADGRLRAGDHLLLDARGEGIVVPPGDLPTITERGEVRIGDFVLARIPTFHVSGPVRKLGASLIEPEDPSQATESKAGVLVGALERANVSPLQATVELISAHRSYESAMKAVESYAELDRRAATLGRIG